jgi:hypothetical protein
MRLILKGNDLGQDAILSELVDQSRNSFENEFFNVMRSMGALFNLFACLSRPQAVGPWPASSCFGPQQDPAFTIVNGEKQITKGRTVATSRRAF